ncbi:hypothetical protein [Flavobacterium sp.]|nr:hypothetical protein [Flavobacterium sp.]
MADKARQKETRNVLPVFFMPCPDGKNPFVTSPARLLQCIATPLG